MKDLLRRLADKEDGFTERKPEGAGTADFKRTLVAFANSAPEDRPAVLFIGVGNDGKILGISSPDSLQKTIRDICEKDCYPPINFQCQVLNAEGKDILAVIVPWSTNRPHFAGPAYVRRGPESVVASEQVFQELISSRSSKVAEILKWKNQVVTVEAPGKVLGFPQSKTQWGECVILDCNSHCVKMQAMGTDRYFSKPLPRIELAWDLAKNRLKLIVMETP